MDSLILYPTNGPTEWYVPLNFRPLHCFFVEFCWNLSEILLDFFEISSIAFCLVICIAGFFSRPVGYHVLCDVFCSSPSVIVPLRHPKHPTGNGWFSMGQSTLCGLKTWTPFLTTIKRYTSFVMFRSSCFVCRYFPVFDSFYHCVSLSAVFNEWRDYSVGANDKLNLWAYGFRGNYSN